MVDDTKTFVIEDENAPDPARNNRIRSAAETLLRAAQGPGVKLPMLPETAGDALRLANDPRTPMNALERVIVRDGALAARMLTVAASTAYAGRPVRSLGGALAMLGTGAVRDLLYQAVMDCHVFRGKDEIAARNERDHAIAVGNLSRAVCKQVGFDPDPAFVCGLLHDIGRLVLKTMGGHAALAGLAPDECNEVLDVVHPNLGAHMVTRWKLPASVAEAVRRHHKYAGFGPQHDGYSQIGHAVAVADRLAAHLGAGRSARALNDEDLQAIYALGLEPKTVVELATGTLATAA